MKFILGKKLEMSQIFDEKGNVVPVTLIETGPCFVTQVKTKEPRKTPLGQRGKNDGYEAIQIGFEKLSKENKIKKTMKGKPYRYLKEFRTNGQQLTQKTASPTGQAINNQQLTIGDIIDVSIFEEGDKLKISGISKGKGFAGAVKRWGFKDKAKAHGHKDMRRVGSIGCRFPQRVIKGKKMPGRMGSERISVKNLKVIKIDKENNILAVKGAIPGRRGTLVEVRSIS